MFYFLKKLRKRYFLFLLGIFLSKHVVVYSNESSYPVVKSSCCSQVDKIPFELSATLLYLKPNVDDSHYVLSGFDNSFNGSQFPNGKRHQNSTPFSFGFCVEGLFNFCPYNSCLDLRFTYLNAQSADSVSGDFLYDTNGFPGFGSQGSPLYAGTARSENFYTFYAGDITYNRPFIFSSPDSLLFIVGLHGTYIKFNEHTISSGTFIDNDVVRPLLNNLHRNSQFFGIGPQMGLDYQFFFPKRFLSGTWGLLAKIRGALLCSNTKSDLHYVTLRTGPIGVGVDNGDLWRVIPSANSEIGINYTLNCKCVSTVVEIGYEFMVYSRCVNKITGTDVFFAGDMIDVFNNFTLHGPYLKISCSF